MSFTGKGGRTSPRLPFPGARPAGDEPDAGHPGPGCWACVMGFNGPAALPAWTQFLRSMVFPARVVFVGWQSVTSHVARALPGPRRPTRPRPTFGLVFDGTGQATGLIVVCRD